MAGISFGGGGGKKSVDLVIPLVPFIDMLALMITFLMMTAVWTQIGKLQVSQAGGPSESNEPPKPTLQVNLTLTEQGYKLAAGSEAIDIAKTPEGTFDVPQLVEKLQAIKKDHPDQRAITVMAEDTIQYEQLVLAVDGCLAADLPDVSVSAAM